MGKNTKRRKKKRRSGGGGKKGGVMMGMHGGFKKMGRSVLGTGQAKAPKASKSSLGGTLLTVALVVAAVALLLLRFS